MRSYCKVLSKGPSLTFNRVILAAGLRRDGKQDKGRSRSQSEATAGVQLGDVGRLVQSGSGGGGWDLR